LSYGRTRGDSAVPPGATSRKTTRWPAP